MLGQTIGDRFVLRERLGVGTSGTIYLGEHVTLRRKVAVKVLHPELSRDELAIERFRREATSVSGIDNEHIVEIFDFGRAADGRLYLAMEHLEGETLAEVLKREGRLSIERAVDILTQLGEAMMEAHAIGYVHRDLRPRNVFLTRRRGRADYVKLLDFGLAKLVEGGAAASTSLGMTFGDPHYMAPELARGDAVDRRGDIYSMGCITYQMLIGAPPFAGGKVFEVLSRHLDERPVAPRAQRPDLPGWLDETIRRMLAKRPEDRFVTVYRLIEALRQGSASGAAMADDAARRAETSPPPPPARRTPRPEAAPIEIVDDPAPTVPVPRALDGGAALASGWFARPTEDEYLDEPPPRRWIIPFAVVAIVALIAVVVALVVGQVERAGPSEIAPPPSSAPPSPPPSSTSSSTPTSSSSTPTSPSLPDDAARSAIAAKLGDRALAAGDALGAATEYSRAARLDPRNVDALAGLGEIALGQGDLKEAIARLEQAAAVRRDSARVQRLLGEAYLGGGRTADAARSFRRALAVDPTDERARAGLTAAAGR